MNDKLKLVLEDIEIYLEVEAGQYDEAGRAEALLEDIVKALKED